MNLHYSIILKNQKQKGLICLAQKLQNKTVLHNLQMQNLKKPRFAGFG